MKKTIAAAFTAAVIIALCLMSGCASTSAVITLDGDTATVSGTGASVDGSTVTITSPGSYDVSGTLNDGQLAVNANGSVTINLKSSSITNTADDAVHVKSGAVTIVLADGTENSLVSGTADMADEGDDDAAQAAADDASAESSDADGEITDDTDDASGAALFSKDALTISGTGALTVTGYINNGIAGKTGVTVESGALTVTAANDGIKSSQGAISIADGTIAVTAAGDGISAQTDLNISGGTINVTSGDGSEAEYAGWDSTQMTDKINQMVQNGQLTVPDGTDVSQIPQMDDSGNAMSDIFGDTEDDSTSMKGIKAGESLEISGGTITINATGHAVHSGGAIDVTSGTMNISSSAGKGISGHGNVTIGGETTAITIAKATEGIESKAILTVNNGNISVTASDDGFNAGGGSSGFGFRNNTATDTSTDTTTGTEADTTETHQLIINGGTVYVNASGDGLDSNGDLTINGGTVIVDGPTSGGDGAIDSGSESGGACTVNGGTVIAVGSSVMAEGFEESSTQYSFMYCFDSAIPAGTQVSITDADGNVLYSDATAKEWSSIVFSSAELANGGAYTITAGDQSATVTLSSMATNSATTGTFGGTFGGMGGGKGGSFGGAAPTLPDGSTFDPSQIRGGGTKGTGGKTSADGTTTTTPTAAPTT